MFTTEWYIIGSLTMPSTWLAVLAAMLLTTGAMWLRYNKQIAGRTLDHFITFILIWKFSVLLTDTKTVIDQPLSLLYFNGGVVGILISTVAVAILIWRQSQPLPVIEIVGYLFGFYSLVMVILNENTVGSELITLGSGIVVLLLTWWTNQKRRTILGIALTGMIFLTAFLQPLGVSNMFTWWTFMAVLFGYCLQQIGDSRKEYVHD